MIQIGIKPMSREGLNISALIAVRDKRHLRFEDSLLGIVESSLDEGPIYFSCCPNYTVAFDDPNILETLDLDIKTEGFNMMPGTRKITLVYRIFYKPEYKVDIPQSSKGSKRDPSSPTMSEMGYSVFSLKEETIFSEKIQKCLNKTKNLEKRKWFLTCLNNKQRTLYTKRYEEWIRKTGSNLDFFSWLKNLYFPERNKVFPDFQDICSPSAN